MRRLLVVLGVLAAVAGCRRGCGVRYEIVGDVEPCDTAYLVVDGAVLDSMAAGDGHISFTGTLKEPRYAVLASRERGRFRPLVNLFIEDGHIVVSGGEASGTPSNDALCEADSLLLDLTLRYYAEAVPEDEKQRIEQSVAELQRAFVERNRDNIFGVYRFYTELLYELDADGIEEQIEQFSAEMQRSVYIARAREIAKVLRRSSTGRRFIEVNLDDVNGNASKLSEAVASSGVVLLDFWASWCGPCMREMPDMVRLYGEFHGRGLEIYGVSLDNNAQAWRKAVERFGMSWVNVSDLQGWHSLPAGEYGVGAIPCNVLIGRDGVIVGRNLHGESLWKRLEELLPPENGAEKE